MMRTLLALAMIVALALCQHANARDIITREANAVALDTSMLDRYSPASLAELQLADPVALSYLAKGWLLAGHKERAYALLDELERRGRAAFGISQAWAPFPPVKKEPNPADAVYVVTLVQVADAFRVGGRDKALSEALTEMRDIPMASGGSCWPNSVYDVAAGCLHDVNLIAMAFLSRIGRNVDREIAYANSKMVQPGAWLFWEEAPLGYWAHRKIMDAGHLGWSAFEMIHTSDARLKRFGVMAAHYVSRNFDPEKAPYFAAFAVAAAEVAADIPSGCDRADALPEWAADNEKNDLTRKNLQWAAFVHVWAQTKCAAKGEAAAGN